MEQIGVLVYKAVPLDRDGSTFLIKGFIEWAVREGIDLREHSAIDASGAHKLAKQFTDRYITLEPGQEGVKGQ